MLLTRTQATANVFFVQSSSYGLSSTTSVSQSIKFHDIKQAEIDDDLRYLLETSDFDFRA
jgi:hypothetical protein